MQRAMLIARLIARLRANAKSYVKRYGELTVIALVLVVDGERLVWNSPVVGGCGGDLAHVVALLAVGEVEDEDLEEVEVVLPLFGEGLELWGEVHDESDLCSLL